MIVVCGEPCQLEDQAPPHRLPRFYRSVRKFELSGAFKRLAILIPAALVTLALWDQIVRDPDYRTWHGRVFGIPYDFRLPIPSRVREAIWSPASERLLSPHVFGVGWTVNAGRVFQLIRNHFGSD